jgi:hypothetical protein
MMNQLDAETPENLTDRVEARVKTARLALDRRADAITSGQPLPPLNPYPNRVSTDELREFQSLRRVFRDLGVTYRRYRKQTGSAATPGLRDAAYNFRAEPSLTSLVAVAAFLDRLDLLN